MKRIAHLMLTSIILTSTHASAVDYSQVVKDSIVNLGKMIENVDNVPFVGKLTDVLPFRIVASSFKECPGQSALVLTCALLCILSRNEKIRSTLHRYNIFNVHRSAMDQLVPFDDMLFILAGEDAEDALEEEDMEDELLKDINDVLKVNHASPVRPGHSVFL